MFFKNDFLIDIKKKFIFYIWRLFFFKIIVCSIINSEWKIKVDFMIVDYWVILICYSFYSDIEVKYWFNKFVLFIRIFIFLFWGEYCWMGNGRNCLYNVDFWIKCSGLCS